MTSDYASPFPVLSHTLSDADAARLRSAVYAHFEEVSQADAKSAGDEETALLPLEVKERLVKVATEELKPYGEQLDKESGRQTNRIASKIATMGLFAPLGWSRKA